MLYITSYIMDAFIVQPATFLKTLQILSYFKIWLYTYIAIRYSIVLRIVIILGWTTYYHVQILLKKWIRENILYVDHYLFMGTK